MFRISTASLICFVLLVIGWPNVECERNAIFGSKPKSLTTLAADIAISDSVKRALFVGYALELTHELQLPFRVGIAGSGKGNFCHIDIAPKSNPRIWIY